MRPSILMLVVAVAGCSQAPPGTVSPDSLAAAASTITPSDIHARITFLASDEMEGRDTPSPGLDSAAAWIADELASFGLEPAGEEGWFQRYPYPAESLDPARTRLEVSAGATHSFEYGTDYFAWRGAPVAAAVGAVYAGTDVAAAEGEFRDRAVLIRFDGLPAEERGRFGFTRETRGRLGRIIERAAGAGASAVVFILDGGLTPGELAALADNAESPSRTVGGVAEEDRPLPAFFLSRRGAERLFRMAGLDAAPLLTAASQARPLPLAGVTLRMRAPARVVEDSRPPNVAGVLRGSDPDLRDSYVVVSAHMDHVGVGLPDATGDSIYNGADDNASGTAVLLEVAEAMGRLPEPPRRSVLFLAVSGEEKGLLGSRWFADHPTVPLEAMVANVNLDMVGRNAPDSIVVIGQEYSSLGRTVRDVARRHHAELGLTAAEDLWPEQRFFFRSDHFSFARREIPALFFFAGTHGDYHRPGDEVDHIDTDKAARVGRLVFYLVHSIAENEQAPEWDRQGLETVRSLTRD